MSTKVRASESSCNPRSPKEMMVCSGVLISNGVAVMRRITLLSSKRKMSKIIGTCSYGEMRPWCGQIGTNVGEVICGRWIPREKRPRLSILKGEMSPTSRQAQRLWDKFKQLVTQTWAKVKLWRRKRGPNGNFMPGRVQGLDIAPHEKKH